MKIKSDFVTNSSSTSFIIDCKAESSSKDDFIDKFNSFLKDYTKGRSWDEGFQEPPLLTSDTVSQTGAGEFTIRDFVPIYYNENDIPQYIQELFSDSDSDACKALKAVGIKLTKVEVKNLNE